MVNEENLNNNKFISIEEVIPKVYKKVLPFKEYDFDKKYNILDYIKRKKINCKVFIEKGYDVLKLKFFAVQCFLDEGNAYKEKRIDFSNFEDFYNYINGEIYKETCFYGYEFSEEEIKKFNLKIKNLNFSSFVKYQLLDFLPKNELTKIKKEKDNSETLLKIKDFIKECSNIRTLDEYLEKSKIFNNKFKDYYLDTDNLFLRLLLNDYKDEMKELTLNIFSHYYPYCFDGITLDDLIYLYGIEEASKAVDSYDGDKDNRDNKYVYRNKAKFKSRVNDYLDGGFKETIRGSYDKKLKIFEVERSLAKRFRTYYSFTQYFLTFEDFANSLNNDLSNCDISDYHCENFELSKYDNNENTRLPCLAKNNESKITFEVKKWFEKDSFYVKLVNKINKNNNDSSFDTLWEFKYFFDFTYFLGNDISDSDLIMCDGIENINNLKNIKYDNIHVRSDIAIKLGLQFRKFNSDLIELNDFEESNKNEIASQEFLLNNLHDDYEENKAISYVSDIHLIHKLLKNNCLSIDDARYVINIITDNIANENKNEHDFFPICLINGDIASDYGVYKVFIKTLGDKIKGFNFVTLGNHELWSFKDVDFKDIVSNYRSFLENNRFYLVQNNLYCFTEYGVEEISENELSLISEQDLKKRMKEASLIIFGGIGFSGFNEEFNANNGIYRGTITREKEIEESKKFYELYKKVQNALYDKNVIILTHMPLSCWNSENKYQDGFIYVSGHDHKNYYFDDGQKRIYADNQIGYYANEVHLKKLYTKFYYDYFADYKDGIYTITREKYLNFYRGLNVQITFNSKFDDLFMIKKKGKYIFLLNTDNKMYLLQGGKKIRLNNNNVEYYFEKLDIYSENINLVMKEYDAKQKQISKEIKAFNGEGTIHGAIIDINYFNHLYLNPFDGKITPYYAVSMVGKFVYNSLPSLLKSECPELYLEYLKLIGDENKKNELVILKDNNELSEVANFEPDTTIYKISNFLKTLQYNTRFNVIRCWNDMFLNDVSIENGRLLIESMIYPENYKTSNVPIRNQTINKSIAHSLSGFGEQYKENIAKETSTIEVVEYINSSTKAKYRCKLCGHEWSTRPDHFKGRQHYKCPNCKK